MERSEYYVSCVGQLCLTRVIDKKKPPIVVLVDKVINVNGLEFSGRIIYPDERGGVVRKK